MTELIATEKDRLTERLSEHFARNVINIDEYEKMLDLITKIETSRDIIIAERMISAYSDMVTPKPQPESRTAILTGKKYKKQQVSIFSSREAKAVSVSGKAGTFSAIFGSMCVKIDNLPIGTTKLKAEALFGLVEIQVPRNVRITSSVEAVFGGAFIPKDDHIDDDLPHLHIKGEAIFGTISVKRVD